jgi:hypothetical protein
MKYDLNGGVLIIGSLYWQDDLKPGDGVRKQWREHYLLTKAAYRVSVPIRYGRFSGSAPEGNQIYTMVFDRHIPKPLYGKAKAIPFRERIRDWAQLRTQVSELSGAEGNGNLFVKGNEAVWCICTIIFNPKLSEQTRKDILSRWRIELSNCLDGKNIDLEAYGISQDGELQIPWPEEAHEMDFLLATSTTARIRNDVAELTVKEICDYINNRPYFIPNFLNGISTYQDGDIIRHASSDSIFVRSFFKALVERYEQKKKEDIYHRYWSWDHCFQTFQSEAECGLKSLHLANYLASWGMNRGSGGLLQKNYRIHEEIIKKLLSEEYATLTASLPGAFSLDRIKLMMKLKGELTNYYGQIAFERSGEKYIMSATDTLVSKVLLGTLACVPAFDQFFIFGLSITGMKVRSLNQRTVEIIGAWIERHQIEDVIMTFPDDIKRLPVMKLVDIYFWSIGYVLASNRS